MRVSGVNVSVVGDSVLRSGVDNGNNGGESALPSGVNGLSPE